MGKIVVFLDRVSHLVDADIIGTTDPYVKFHLEQDNAIFDKNYGKKTSTKKKGDQNPVYGETFEVTEDTYHRRLTKLWRHPVIFYFTPVGKWTVEAALFLGYVTVFSFILFYSPTVYDKPLFFEVQFWNFNIGYLDSHNGF